MADASDDLLVVELRSVEGSPGWLDDRTLSGVWIDNEVLSIVSLRRLIQKRVDTSKAPGRRVSTRSVYASCSVPDCGGLLITLVPVSDLRLAVLEDAEAPQQKRKS